MAKFTIGCDPEIFLRKNGKPVSAHDLLPGDKENPHKTEGGAIQVDGMAAEFNTDPCDLEDFTTFNSRILLQQRHIRDALPKDKGYSLHVAPIQEFGKEFIDQQPLKAKELGCDPDFNAYTLKENPRPDAENSTFRTGAGHIHVGWGADIPIDNKEHIEICAEFVKMLDLHVGLFMTLIDQDPRRRDLYGCAGAFRPKPYGVEYRTPSNVWIKNETYRRLVHKLVVHAVKAHSDSRSFRSIACPYGEVTPENVQSIINNGRIKEAFEILCYVTNWIWPGTRRFSNEIENLEFPNKERCL